MSDEIGFDFFEMGVFPLLVQGRAYSFVTPALMHEKEFRSLSTQLNSDKEHPLKMFQLADSWGMIWGYDFDRTLDFFAENYKEVTEDVVRYARGSRRGELAKVADFLPNPGSTIGLFNVSDENTTYVDFNAIPTWGITYTDIENGHVKPLGMSDDRFKELQGNVTAVLREAKLNAGHDSLLFEWVG